MIKYTLTARDTGLLGKWIAEVKEYPGLIASGYDGPSAKAALMKLVIARAQEEEGRKSRTASERAYAARERERNAVGNLERENPNPLKTFIEPEAPRRPASMDESNWRSGGWARGGVLR